MATKTEPKYIGDVVEFEVNENYCREIVTVGNSQTVLVGSPLDLNGATGGAGLITNTNEANVDAIALEAVTTGGSETASIVALVRGPAVVNGDQLELETDVTVTEMKTNLLANIEVVVLEESDSLNEGVGQ